MKPKQMPTARERGQLTRIYGDEENWLHVTTCTSKKKRNKMVNRQRMLHD